MTSNDIIFTIPAPCFQSLLQEFQKRNSAEPMVALCRCGQYARGNRIELLYRSISFPGRPEQLLPEAARSAFPVLIFAGTDLPDSSFVYRLLSSLSDVGVRSVAFIAITTDNSTVRAFGFYKHDEVFGRISYLSLPGAGMSKIAVSLWPAIDEPLSTAPSESSLESPETLVLKDNRLDRLATFLGEGNRDRGSEILGIARRLRITIIGSGRMGSLLVLELAKSGVGQSGSLFLVDADQVEEVNLDAMLLPPQAIGMAKAEAVARMALLLQPQANVLPIVGTLSDKISTEAVAASDMVFSCVDRQSARFGTAALAARYLRPHIDLSSGAAYVRGGVSVGGEVRLAIPGLPGCAACFGDSDWIASEQELSSSAKIEQQARLANDAQAERPGSSGALLHAVVGIGMHLFWRLLAGKERRSIWLHLDANGSVPKWHDWTEGIHREACRICEPKGLTGLGDWGGQNA